MRSMGIFLNPSKPQALSIARTLTQCCRAQGMDVQVIHADAPDCAPPDVLAVLGGDGTILRAVHLCERWDIPILGINLGRLGFLAEVEPEDVEQMLVCLRQGAYTLEKRMLMQVALPDGQQMPALNDVVISRGSCARMIALEASASNGELIDRYIADGLVISTPTGSTAYSLSAGGPIVSPDVNCLILAPVCAHSLKSRPIVVSDREEIRVRVRMEESREGMLVTVDGQDAFPICNQACITLRRAPRDISFVRFSQSRNFFALLRGKLSDWS